MKENNVNMTCESEGPRECEDSSNNIGSYLITSNSTLVCQLDLTTKYTCVPIIKHNVG
jgi:hypothetical protein